MSSSESLLKLLFTRPDDFRALLQFKIWHAPTRDLTAIQEHPTSGWDRRSMRRCWEFLDMTSRSFAAVIKELDGDLARVVSSFFAFRLLPCTPRHGRPARRHPLYLLSSPPNDQHEQGPLTRVPNSPDLHILPRVEGAGHRRR